ncbi:hypothetical protein [Chryseobacterium sp.]|uniref:hypothetical protein n=1 Tax=Chryseobacterium sp. TaxID=1871047 RepID=UPI001E4403C7|nr:hypothetical protein [Chryseobacterium sp.]
MKKLIFTALLLILNSCAVTIKQKDALKNELAQILKSDQELRELFTTDISAERKKKF